MTQHHCNKLKSIGHSERDATINAKKNLKSTNSPPDLINKATTSSDPGTSITLNESFPDKKEGEVLRTGVSSCYTNLKSKADNNSDSMPIDNDFGDFVDFSSKSVDAFSSEFGISSEKDEDSTLGSYSKEKERIFYQSGESEFDAFTESVSTETKDLTRNDMKWPKPDFKECSESAGSENEPAFQADFGAFSESEFCAFSESTDSKNKQSDFGAFSESTYSKNNQSAFIAVSQSALFQKSTKQLAMQTQLVSFDACFEGVFPALEIALEDLEHVKTGMKSLNQDNLWNSLYSNMGEAAIRFNWEKCKTSEKICKALKVSWKNIVANPNILAMSEGLDVPVFATGLGILQPSIVPAPPKKRKTKCKQKQDVSIKQEGSGTSLPVSSLAQQTAFPDFKTESIKDNNSDTGSLSNSDTASLDLDFFASAPSNLVTNLGDQNLSSNLYNLDFTFGPAVPQIQACGTNIQAEMNVFKPSKSLQDDPLVILKKLDNSKMSSFGNGSGTRLSPRAKQIIETFEDLSFMHSSVLMFPLQNDN